MRSSGRVAIDRSRSAQGSRSGQPAIPVATIAHSTLESHQAARDATTTHLTNSVHDPLANIADAAKSFTKHRDRDKEWGGHPPHRGDKWRDKHPVGGQGKETGGPKHTPDRWRDKHPIGGKDKNPKRDRDHTHDRDKTKGGGGLPQWFQDWLNQGSGGVPGSGSVTGGVAFPDSTTSGSGPSPLVIFGVLGALAIGGFLIYRSGHKTEEKGPKHKTTPKRKG